MELVMQIRQSEALGLFGRVGFDQPIEQSLVERAEASGVEDLDLGRLRRDRLAPIAERELDPHPLRERVLEGEHVGVATRQLRS